MNLTVPGYYNAYLQSEVGQPLTYIDWFQENIEEIEERIASDSNSLDAGLTDTDSLVDMPSLEVDSQPNFEKGWVPGGNTGTDPGISNPSRHNLAFEWRLRNPGPSKSTPFPNFPLLSHRWEIGEIILAGTATYSTSLKGNFRTDTYSAGLRLNLDFKYKIELTKKIKDFKIWQITYPIGLARYRKKLVLNINPQIEVNFTLEGKADYIYKQEYFQNSRRRPPTTDLTPEIPEEERPVSYKSLNMVSLTAQPGVKLSAKPINGDVIYVHQRQVGLTWVNTHERPILKCEAGVKAQVTWLPISVYWYRNDGLYFLDNNKVDGKFITVSFTGVKGSFSFEAKVTYGKKKLGYEYNFAIGEAFNGCHFTRKLDENGPNG
jgi:hypothetical protein